MLWHRAAVEFLEHAEGDSERKRLRLPWSSVKCPCTFQSYVPVMEAGSDVTFRWTVDDKPSFTFYNVVFNVIYQSPAVYKLSVSQGLSRGTISGLLVHWVPPAEKEKQQSDT